MNLKSFLLIALCTLIITTISSSSSPPPPLFGVQRIPRAGSLLSKSRRAAKRLVKAASLSKTKTINTTSLPPLSSSSPTNLDSSSFEPLTQKEVTTLLNQIQIYAVTDSNGQSVVLQSPPSETTPTSPAKSILYFYLSPKTANGTLTRLLEVDDELKLGITSFPLGDVYFGSGLYNASLQLQNANSSSAEVEYRLLPETRDLIGSRMLLSLSNSTSSTPPSTEQTKENVASALKSASQATSTAGKFGRSYNNIPVFMIQQMRMSIRRKNSTTGVISGPEVMLPIYLSLNDMISTWTSFTKTQAKNDGSEIPEPAIHLMELSELVGSMLGSASNSDNGDNGRGVDWRKVLIIGGSGVESSGTGTGGGKREAGEGGGQVSTQGDSNASGRGGGGGTLGDL